MCRPVPKMRGRDQKILNAARQSRMPVEKFVASQLGVVLLALQDEDLLQDHVRLRKAMGICDRIYSSHIFNIFLAASGLGSAKLNKLRTDLGKFGAYCNTGVFHYQHFHLSGQGQSVARE